MSDDTDEPLPLLEAERFDEAFLRLWRPHPDDHALQLAGIQALLEDEALGAGARLLDVCGGHGRIARPLAMRGYRVTCVDASPAMLEHGRAAHGGDMVTFVCADARRLEPGQHGLDAEPWDAALLVQQSFGYFATDIEHAQMMRAIGHCLRPGAVLIFDVVQRDFAATAVAPRTWHELPDGRAVLHTFEFDPIAGRSHESVRVEGEPLQATRRWSLRLFNLTELAHLLHAGQLVIEAAFGDYDLRPFHVGEPRLVVLARRS